MDKDKFPVLSVKFKMPSPRTGYVVREDLMSRLDEIKNRKLIIVKGGAGSGKTTLLSVYIKERKYNDVKWITLDADLNQPFLFWRYILQALEDFLVADAGYLFECFDSNMQKEMLEQLICMLVENLSEKKDIILVLDDFHMITDSYLCETFNHFLYMIPENVHLVLLSRKMPKIDIGNMYMEGWLLVINEEQLRFSDEQCEEFLTKTLGIKKNEEQIKNIVKEANGWIGGAQLMAIAGGITTNSSMIIDTANEQIIYDYIGKEIFAYLSDNEQDFLKKTAILSYFNEEICSRYVPEYPFVPMMKLIFEKNLFVVNIDEDKKEYRYHAIFRGFLLHLISNNENEKEKFTRRAAEIVFECGDYDEAVRLLFEIKDYKLLMQYLMRMPQNVITFSYMMRVPMEAIKDNVNFAYQYFFLYYATLDLQAAEKIYRFIATTLKNDETIQLFKNADLFFDMNAVVELSKMSMLPLEHMEKVPLNDVTKAYLYLKEAYFYFIADNQKEAMRYLDAAEAVYRRTKNVCIECLVLSERTQILEQYGYFNEALLQYELFKELMEQLPSIKQAYYVGIAGIYIRQMRLKEAGEMLDAIEAGEYNNKESFREAYLYTRAEWYYTRGEQDKTMQILELLQKISTSQNILFCARLLHYPVYRKRNEKMARAFAENYENSDEKIKTVDLELLYIRIQYEYYDKKVALERLDVLIAKARKVKNKFMIVEGSLLKMHFLYEQGADSRRVVNLFVEAVSYACPENMAQEFWYEKEYLQQVVYEYGEEIYSALDKKQIDFLAQILELKIDKKDKDANILSKRELEVLKEIADGYTNREIADHLCISVATVKTHIINIYGKLGVNNRIAAAKKLKSLRS